MVLKLFIFNFVLVPLLIFSQKSEDDILGNWLATDNSVLVKVYKIDRQFRAKILWFDDRLGSGKPMYSRHDTANPDPESRKRKIIGMEVLEGLKYDPNTHSWENGTIYDASSGRHWDSSATLKDNILKVRGYWKFKWIGKSMSFIKTNQTTSIKK